MPLIFVFHEEQYLKSLEFYLYYFYVPLCYIKLSVHFTCVQLAVCPDPLPWNDAQYCIHFGHSSYQILFCCYLLCSWWWKQTPVIFSFVKELSKWRGFLLIFPQQIRISSALQVLNTDFFGMVQYSCVLTLADCQLSTNHSWFLSMDMTEGEICIEKLMHTNKGREISY